MTRTVADGGTIKLGWKDTVLKLSCCDCGLTHDFRFDVRGKRMLIIVNLDKRTTARQRKKDKRGNNNGT